MNNHEHRTKKTYESYTFQPLMSFWYPPMRMPPLQLILLEFSSFLTDPNRYVYTTLAWGVTVFSFSYYFRPLGLVSYFLYSCDSAAFLVAFNLDLFVYKLTLSSPCEIFLLNSYFAIGFSLIIAYLRFQIILIWLLSVCFHSLVITLFSWFLVSPF